MKMNDQVKKINSGLAISQTNDCMLVTKIFIDVNNGISLRREMLSAEHGY
jgi:hypothetical protein